MLVHVGAAHAGRPGPRGIANPERARRQSRETRPRAGALAWGLPQPSWAAASGRAGRRAGQCGSWPPVPSSPWRRRPIPKDRAGTRPGRWDLGVGPRQGRRPTLGAQAHSPPVRDSGRRARTRRFTHCALPWQRPTLGGPTQSPPYVHSRASASRWAVRMRTARIARIADRLDGMPRCHPRVWPWWLHTHARGYAVLRLTRGDD